MVIDMLIVIKAKDTDNIIGLKEDIAMRLESAVDVDFIGVYTDDELTKVRQGVWKYQRFTENQTGYTCSCCHHTEETPRNYCPNCGAKIYRIDYDFEDLRKDETNGKQQTDTGTKGA